MIIMNNDSLDIYPGDMVAAEEAIAKTAMGRGHRHNHREDS